MTPALLLKLEALVYALLHSLWQSGVAFLVLWMLLRFIPARKAQLRYGLGVFALTAILAANVFTWAWLDVSVARKPQTRSSESSVALVAATKSVDATPSVAMPVGEPSPSSEQPSFQVASSPAVPKPMLAQNWIPWIAGVWLLGVLVFLIRTLHSMVGAGRLRKDSREVTDPALLALASEIGSLLKIAKRVRIFVSDHINMPAVIGCLQPVVLLPASMLTGAHPEYLRAVLAHEFAHIKRWDYLINIAQMLIESLLFFNPFVWWISRQIRREREACCDQIAAQQCQTPAHYLKAVIACAQPAEAEMRHRLPDVALALGGPNANDDKPLVDRAKRLLQPGYRPAVRVRWLTMLGILAGTALILYSMIQGAHVAAKILTPKERIEQIAELRKEYAKKSDLNQNSVQKNIRVSGSVLLEDGAELPKLAEMGILSESSDGAGFDERQTRIGAFDHEVSSGKITVYAWAQGYAPVVAGPFQGDNDLKDIHLVLKKGFEATVRVTDESSKPIEGVEITLAYGSTRFPNNGLGKATVPTNSNGEAKIANAESVNAALRLRKLGFKAVELNEVKLDPQNPLNLTMSPGNHVAGVVRALEDPSKIIPKATFHIAQTRKPDGHMGYGLGGGPVFATTDEKGAFVIDTLLDGVTYIVVVKADGYRPALLKLTNESGNVDVSLKSALSMKGKVINLPPNADARISYYEYVRAPGELNTIHNPHQRSVELQMRDGVGHFELRDLYEGLVNFFINGKGYQLDDFTESRDDIVIDFAAKPEDEEVLISNVPKRKVVIQFDVPEGSPAAEGSLKITYQRAGNKAGFNTVVKPEKVEKPQPKEVVKGKPNRPLTSWGEKTISVANGRAEIEAPVPNRLNLNLDGLTGYTTSPKFNRDWNGPFFEVGEGATVFEQRIPVAAAGAIYGEIVNADGSALNHVRVEVRGASSEFVFRHMQGTRKDDLTQGFIVTPLPLGGEYLLKVKKDPSVVVAAQVRLDEKMPNQKMRIVIPVGKTIYADVSDEDGKAVPDHPFYFTTSENPGSNIELGFYRSDENGRVTIPEVNTEYSGSYTLRSESQKDYIPAFYEFIAGQSPVKIQLSKGLILEGVAINVETGKPMADAKIYALPNHKKPASAVSELTVAHQAEAITDAEGRFRFSNLPDKEMTIQSYSAYLEDLKTPPVARPGQTEPVILKLKPYPRNN